MPLGRKIKEIKWDNFDKLCVMQCTKQEIATFFECSDDTINRACKREKHMTFAAYFDQKRQNGKISLRRKMYEMALAGDRVMLIWLSKNYLGMSEKVEQKSEAHIQAVVSSEQVKDAIKKAESEF